jgi:hypothetical protein
MPPKPIDLDVVRRFIQVETLARRTDSLGEAQSARAALKKMEGDFPGLRATVDRVRAAMAEPPPDRAPPPPRGDHTPMDKDAVLRMLHNAAEDMAGDPDEPWWRRVATAFSTGRSMYQDAADFVAPPLDPGHAEVMKPVVNARGELVVRLRIRPDDARKPRIREALARELAETLRRHRS